MGTITIGSQPIIEHTNCFIVRVSGSFGDMDETFHQEEEFVKCDHQMLSHLAMWDQIIHNYGRYGGVETRQDIQTWLEENKYDEDVCIPVDSCSYEMLPNCIDGFEIVYYNDKGQCFPVQYEA